MPVAGLIITLSPDPAPAARALRDLAARPGLLLGIREGNWISAAAEGFSDEECRRLHDWIGSREGVEHVDVVCVEFEASSDETGDQT